MAITTLAQLNAALAASQRIFNFIGGMNVVGGWTGYAAMTPASGSVGQIALPGAYSVNPAGTTYTQGAAGNGYPVWRAAPSGQSSYIGRFAAQSLVAGAFLLYDLLWGCSGFDSTVTTSQNLNGFSGLPTRAGSAAKELWLQVTGALGATLTIATITYTNQSGVSGRQATLTINPTVAQGRIFQVPLQSGDTGVQSIQSLQFSASTGTAGNVGLLLMNRITQSVSNRSINYMDTSDFAALGLPVVDDAAVLFPILAANTSNGNASGFYQLEIIQG
jgi:hypothetical protein